MFKYKIRISEPFDKDNVLEFEINSPHRLNEKLLYEEFKKLNWKLLIALKPIL